MADRSPGDVAALVHPEIAAYHGVRADLGVAIQIGRAVQARLDDPGPGIQLDDLLQVDGLAGRILEAIDLDRLVHHGRPRVAGRPLAGHLLALAVPREVDIIPSRSTLLT